MLHVGIAILLVVAALALLVSAAGQLLAVVEDGADKAIIEVLDTLLLVFVVAELLYAVRETLRRRSLVAEPFLLVGSIASIKEIVVLSVEAAELVDQWQEFRHSVVEIGVLGILVLVLSVSAVLLRAKEREPAEGEGGDRR